MEVSKYRPLGNRLRDEFEMRRGQLRVRFPCCNDNLVLARVDHSQTKSSRSARPGQLLYADLAGPFVASAHGGYHYALVLVDDFTRYKWVYFLRNKSEAPQYINNFIGSFNALLSKRFGADGAEPFTVAAIHTDNAGEFLSREFD